MSTELNKPNSFLLYTSNEGAVKVDVLLKDETIWLIINQLATLFDIDKSGVSRHIKNIFETGELQEEATVAKIATVQTDVEKNSGIRDFKKIDIKLSLPANMT